MKLHLVLTIAIFYLEQKSQLVSNFNHCFHFCTHYSLSIFGRYSLLEEKDCGNGGIDSLTDGIIIDNPLGDRTYGALVQYKCNNGHVSDDGPYRSCKTDGKWTKKPTCEEVDCGSVIAPQNSNYIATKNGETLTFTCNHGYTINGLSTATCDDDQWTSFPVCNIVHCNNPAIPNNGQRTGNSFTYSSQLSYSCDVGYTLMGSTDIVCLSTGQWSDAVPTCSIVNCGDPGVFSNGTIRSGNSFTYNSTIVFQCANGFSTFGSTEIICNSNGQWSDNVPICSVVNCGNPGFISNGTRNGNSYMYDSIVTFKCDEGYTLLGSASIICQSSSKWNSSIPECELISDEISSSGSYTSGISSSNSNQITSVLSNESHQPSLIISSASVSNFPIKTSSSIQQKSSSVKLPLLSTSHYDTTLSPDSSLPPVADAVKSGVSVGVVAAIAIVLVVVVIVLIIGGVIGLLVLRYNRKCKNSKRNGRDCIAPLTSQGNKLYM